MPFVKAQVRRYDVERDKGEQRQWIHSTRWRKASDAHKRAHPLCAECERQGRTTAAYLTDHVVPHEGNYELFWDEGNWQSMCNEHHEAKHKKDRWGKSK